MSSAVNMAVELAVTAVHALRSLVVDGENLFYHSLATATSALNDGAPAALVTAALLHDVGHGFDLRADQPGECGGDDRHHAERGADWLLGLFGPDVSEPVRLHVEAKRYVSVTDPAWFAGLKRASVASLSNQGGPMDAREVAQFRSEAYFLDALRLRYYDDSPCLHPVQTLEGLRPLLAAAASGVGGRPRTCDDRPLVYVAMSADVIHKGHINVIERAAELGRVIVGLLTDSAIAGYKRVPLFDFQHRCRVVGALKHVDAIVAQTTLNYTQNLVRFKPRYVVHGDDWRSGVQAKTRESAIATLKQWGGELVEVPYTQGVSSTELQSRIRTVPRAPAERCAALSRALQLKPLVRVIEAHNGFSALIADRARVTVQNEVREFDALWSGSLTTAAAKACPDTGVVDFTARTNVLADILRVSHKPVLFDAEDGGEWDEIRAMVTALEYHGVSAIVLEDKVGPKRNSFAEGTVAKLADLSVVEERLRAAAGARNSPNMLLVARLEGMVLGGRVDEAVERALAVEAAGADLILPHSKRSDPAQVFAFASEYRRRGGQLKLMAIPTTYSAASEQALIEHGFSLVVYANQLLRAAVGPMRQCALDILEHGSCGVLDGQLLAVRDLVEVENLSVQRQLREPMPSEANC